MKFKLIFDNNKSSEFKGFVNEIGAGRFEGLFNSKAVLHDMIEHGFENSEYFSTSVLDVSGECVAMGIRQYLYEYSKWGDYVSYNPYNGLEWNTWNTIAGLLQESMSEDREYPANFDFKPTFSFDNTLFEGYMSHWAKGSNVPPELQAQAEQAVAYGYSLGEKLYGENPYRVCLFAENINKVFQCFEECEITTETISFAEINMSIGKKSIYADFNVNGVRFRISHLKMSTDALIRRLWN